MRNYLTVLTVFLALCTLPVYPKPKQLSSRSDGRIVGGQKARAAQFPYAAAITIQTAAGQYFCGGAILDHEWLLTAAQCVDGATVFSILLGSNSLTVDEISAVKVASDTYYIHPDYNSLTLENDLGLIKFRLPITYSDYIQPINYLSNMSLPDGGPVTSIGWGQTSDGNEGLSNDLNYVNVVTLSNIECRITYGDQIKNGMLCIDGNFNEGTCIGDIGSPLVLYGSRGYTYHAGVASFISGNGCESTDPSGYTRTEVYRDWIRETTINN